MSVVLKLSRDILHSVYSEWLEWKDLSGLDVACEEKRVREVWLTSLTDLRMTQMCFWGRLSDDKMRMFYQWLADRKVFCVDGFVVRLSIIEDLLAVLLDMECFCLALRSIEIEDWSSDASISDVSQTENNLSIFFSHCHNLQEVTVSVYHTGLIGIALQELAEKLRENSLTKISLLGICSYIDYQMIASLLTKHASSLRDLKCELMDEEGADFIMSTLIESQIHLRALIIKMDYKTWSSSALMSYISTAGDLLEVLDVGYGYGVKSSSSDSIDDLVVLVSACCPKLIYISIGDTCSAESLRLLYEQCQHLQDVSIVGAIKTYDYSGSVSIEVKGSSEDWAICLSHALRRRQCKEVTLRLTEEVYYHPAVNLKSMLEPYQIELYASTKEISFISLLHDLPHLNKLHLMRGFDPWSDAILAASIEHANSLTDFHVENVDYRSGIHCSDKQLSELIKTCQLLKHLSVCCCGLESLVAVSKHSSLKDVELYMGDSVSEEMLQAILVDEKVKWPSTLKRGQIYYSVCEFCYHFSKESHRWHK